MRWRGSDINQYKNAKVYIDTIIIPCIPLEMSQDDTMEKLAFQGELLTIFASEIEKELAGRVMLIPAYSYLKSAEKEAEISRMNTLIADLKKQPFTNIFLLTLDATWKKSEQALDGQLIWLPSVQSGNLYSKEMKVMIRDQVDQIIEFIRSYW